MCAVIIIVIRELRACSVSVVLCVQVNDFIRDKLSSHDGVVPHWGEIIAGGCVSASLPLRNNNNNNNK